MERCETCPTNHSLQSKQNEKNTTNKNSTVVILLADPASARRPRVSWRKKKRYIYIYISKGFSASSVLFRRCEEETVGGVGVSVGWSRRGHEGTVELAQLGSVLLLLSRQRRRRKLRKQGQEVSQFSQSGTRKGQRVRQRWGRTSEREWALVENLPALSFARGSRARPPLKRKRKNKQHRNNKNFKK